MIRQQVIQAFPGTGRLRLQASCGAKAKLLYPVQPAVQSQLVAPCVQTFCGAAVPGRSLAFGNIHFANHHHRIEGENR